MDNNKQEAIDVLLLSNACRGELGFQAKALLDKSDQLGQPEHLLGWAGAVTKHLVLNRNLPIYMYIEFGWLCLCL